MNEPEYTLPGVMRFLQTEWQRNERDRIQWDIERAEMKSRIAKLEGEKQELLSRSETYEKSVSLLQRRYAEGDGGNGSPQAANTQSVAAEPQLPTPETLGYDRLADGKKQLSKCVAEIRYLLEQSGMSLEDTSAYRDEMALQAAGDQKFGAKSYLYRTLANYSSAFPAVEFLNASTLVLGTSDGQLILVDLDASPHSEPSASYKVCLNGGITTMRCDVESRTLYVGDSSGKLHLLSFDETASFLDPLNAIDAHTDAITGMAWSPIHELLVTASLDGNCNAWALSRLRERGTTDAAKCRTASMRFYPESLAVKPSAIWFSDDSFVASLPTNHIIIGYSDSSIVIADALTGQMVKRMYSPPSTSFLDRAAPSITAIVGYGVSNGDKHILTAHSTGILRTWNIRIGSMVEEIDATHRRAVTSVSLSPRKDAVVVTSEDGHVSLWTLQLGGVTWKGQLFSHDSFEANGASSSCWSGDMLAIGGADGIARVYNMASF